MNTKFKVGDRVLLKADRSTTSKKYNDKIVTVILADELHYFKSDIVGCGGVWNEEATLVEKEKTITKPVKKTSGDWGF